MGFIIFLSVFRRRRSEFPYKSIRAMQLLTVWNGIRFSFSTNFDFCSLTMVPFVLNNERPSSVIRYSIIYTRFSLTSHFSTKEKTLAIVLFSITAVLETLAFGPISPAGGLLKFPLAFLLIVSSNDSSHQRLFS